MKINKSEVGNGREVKDGLLFTNRGCGYSIYHTLCTSFTSVDAVMVSGANKNALKRTTELVE